MIAVDGGKVGPVEGRSDRTGHRRLDEVRLEPMSTAPRGGPRPPRHKPTKAPTIFDVAKAAGVSKSTVSNVVRGAEQVADGTRARVLDAIERLNYKPNAIARHFVQQRTTILGVLVGDLVEPLLRADGPGGRARSVRVRLRDDVLQHRGRRGDRRRRRRRAARAPGGRNRVPGVHRAHSPAGGRPASGRARRSCSWGSASSGATRSGRATPRADGWRPSTCSSSVTAGSPTCAPRWSSTAATVPATPATGRRCGAPGVPTLPTYTWAPGADSVRVGRERAVARRRAEGGEAPTAVFVSNDIGAIALMDACEARGITVPADLSVVGFDDIAIAVAAPHLAHDGRPAARLPGRARGRPPARAHPQPGDRIAPRARCGDAQGPRIHRSAAGRGVAASTPSALSSELDAVGASR